MNTSQIEGQLLERLIDKTISKKEREVIEKRLSESKELRKELFVRQSVEDLLLEAEIDSLRMGLNRAMQNTSQEKRITPREEAHQVGLKKYMYAAATIAGIAAGGWMIQNIASSDSPTKLYSANYETYPAVLVSRASNELSAHSRLFQAMMDYQSKNFNKAAKSLEQLKGDKEVGITASFYLGVSYMELKQFKQARESLNVVLDTNSILYDQALWYTALSYLGEEDIDKAKQLLTILEKKNSPLSKKAQHLLKKLPE